MGGSVATYIASERSWGLLDTCRKFVPAWVIQLLAARPATVTAQNYSRWQLLETMLLMMIMMTMMMLTTTSIMMMMIMMMTTMMI